MRHQRHLLRIVLVYLCFNSLYLYAALPKDAQEMLTTFPEKSITLELVVGRAVQYSDQFQSLRSYLPRIESPYLQSQASLDPQVYAKVARSLDRNEPQTMFNANKIFSTESTLGISKYFSTGTQSSFELLHSATSIGFQTFSPSEYVQTRGQLKLVQNLWRDSFGYATRLATESGYLLKQAETFQYEDRIESWVYELIQVFYNAWLSQVRFTTAKKNVERRERLLKITQIKLNRGNAERPDYLQVQSSLLNAVTEQTQAEQNLKNQWRGLVTSLKLPHSWMQIDPSEIPILLDSPSKEVFLKCNSDSNSSLPKVSARTEALSYLSQAALSDFKRKKNLLSPSVSLQASLVSNGIDPSNRGTAVQETLHVDHPAWVVGVGFSVPLFQYQEKADAQVAYAEQERLQAVASQENENLKLEWINTCSDIARLSETVKILKNVLENQKQRMLLEEERFRIGRSTTLMVIQAGDDLTLADWNLSNASVQFRTAVWKARRLMGEYKNFLKSLANK